MTWKIGETVVGKDDGVRAFVKGQIVAKHMDGTWIIMITNPSSHFEMKYGDLITKPEWVLNDFYTHEPTFFQVGKEYTRTRPSWSMDTETTLVMDVYHLDNPMWGDSADYAAVKVTDGDGEEYMALLTKNDFPSYSVKK